MKNSGLIVEFHYNDGDVGVHLGVTADEVNRWWKHHHKTASHIVIRPDTETGQELSNALEAAFVNFLDDNRK